MERINLIFTAKYERQLSFFKDYTKHYFKDIRNLKGKTISSISEFVAGYNFDSLVHLVDGNYYLIEINPDNFRNNIMSDILRITDLNNDVSFCFYHTNMQYKLLVKEYISFTDEEKSYLKKFKEKSI